MNKIKNYWERYFLILDVLIPVVITAVFIIWSEVYSGWDMVTNLLADNRSAIYGTLSAIYGALLGFVITAVSIVLGYISNDSLTIVRESDRYQDLWTIYKGAMRTLAIATITGLFGLIFDRDSHPVPWMFYINFLSTTLVFFWLGRSIWVLEKIISLVTGKNADDEDEEIQMETSFRKKRGKKTRR